MSFSLEMYVAAMVGNVYVHVHVMPLSPPRRFHLSDLLYHKIIKEHEDLLLSKIVLPVCVQLGLRSECDHCTLVEEYHAFLFHI